jgi:hypothetical protein
VVYPRYRGHAGPWRGARAGQRLGGLIHRFAQVAWVTPFPAPTPLPTVRERHPRRRGRSRNDSKRAITSAGKREAGVSGTLLLSSRKTRPYSRTCTVEPGCCVHPTKTKSEALPAKRGIAQQGKAPKFAAGGGLRLGWLKGLNPSTAGSPGPIEQVIEVVGQEVDRRPAGAPVLQLNRYTWPIDEQSYGCLTSSEAIQREPDRGTGDGKLQGGTRWSLDGCGPAQSPRSAAVPS